MKLEYAANDVRKESQKHKILVIFLVILLRASLIGILILRFLCAVMRFPMIFGWN